MDSKPKALLKHPEILSLVMAPSLELGLSWVSLRVRNAIWKFQVSIFITHVCLALGLPSSVEWKREKACIP